MLIPKISVVTILWNEIQNIRFYLDQFLGKEFIGEIIVLDGGSTDGTLDVIHEYKDKLFIDFSIQSQNKSRFCQGWEETSRRNWTLKHAAYPWILMIDADEIVGDDMWREIQVIVETETIDVAGFCRVNYIKNPNLIWNFPGEMDGTIPRLWRKNLGALYSQAPLHCTPVLPSGQSLRCMLEARDERAYRSMSRFHHLHRLLWPGKPTYTEYATLGTAVETAPTDENIVKDKAAGKISDYAGPWPELFLQKGWL